MGFAHRSNMMFSGSTNVGKNEYSLLIDERWRKQCDNSEDRTLYSHRAFEPTDMILPADRMRNST
jgi:hypothetical protein